MRDNQIIFNENDPSDEIIFIVEGNVNYFYKL